MSKSPKVKTSGLCAALAPCRKEEEVKAEFCRFFGMKINALRTIDHYTESILFEFKYDQSADTALQQIEDKGYAKPFATDGRKIVKIGVNFSREHRCIDEWKIKE